MVLLSCIAIPRFSSAISRAWPLLTGERGHYELAAGNDPRPLVAAMERFASRAGFLPEQVWDAPDRPNGHLEFGGPTGSATPLAWAHAEYLTLLRSIADGTPYDLLPELARRYSAPERHRDRVEVWKPNLRTEHMAPGGRLRVLGEEPFRLHWTLDEWATVHETASERNALQLETVDVLVPEAQSVPLRFTFFWPSRDAWEGRDYQVGMDRSPRTDRRPEPRS